MEKEGEKRIYTQWSKELIIEEIRKIGEERGEIPSITDILRINARLYNAARRFFGTWDAAVRAAGFVPTRRYRMSRPEGGYDGERRSYTRWSPERVVREIQKLQKRGSDLSKKGVRTHHNSLYNAARRYYGSWENVMGQLGIDIPPTVRKQRKRRKQSATTAKRRYIRWSEEKVLQEIKKLHESGVYLSKKTARTEYNSLFNAARRYFGSWESSLDKVGITLPPTRRGGDGGDGGNE